MDYQLIDADGNVAYESQGNLKVSRKGLVNLNNYEISTVRKGLINPGYYFQYDDIEYKITSFPSDSEVKFYIDDYALGDAAGVTAKILHCVASMKEGFFHYQGHNIRTSTNYETALEIVNGANHSTNDNLIIDNDRFKENFLVKIDDNYFRIEEINNFDIALSGHQDYDWKTLIAGGTLVDMEIIQYLKEEVVLFGKVFPEIDREGVDDVEVLVETSGESAMFAHGSNDGSNDVLTASESVMFEIQYKNGNKEQGAL